MLDSKTLTPPELYQINQNAQRAHIAISALEYFASMLVSGVFLASLLTKIGVPDAVAGIVASLTSFGAFAQIAALFFANRVHSAKRIVATTQVLSQVMFVTLYLVPFVKVSQGVKTTLFVVLYLSAIFSKTLVMPIRTNWTMSYVDRDKRGSYTATNEMVSLVGGMAFSWIMGALIDHYNAIGKSGTGFILSGIALFGLSVLVLLCYLPIKELKPAETEKAKISFKSALKGTLGDKGFRQITYLKLIWNVAIGISTPFHGTYINNQLGISLAMVSIISALGCGMRAVISRPFGRFADRTSRAKSLIISMSASALAFLVFSFAAPGNGVIMYTIFVMIDAIHAAGATNGLTNIVFDFIKPDMRTNAFAIQGALSGGISLLSTLVGAKVVSTMQASGNTLFGITVYPQQLLSFVSCLVMVVLIIYVKAVIEKLKRVDE